MIARARILKLVSSNICYAITGLRSSTQKRRKNRGRLLQQFCSNCGSHADILVAEVSRCCACAPCRFSSWWHKDVFPDEGFWRSTDNTLFRIEGNLVYARKNSLLLPDLKWKNVARISLRNGDRITMVRTNTRDGRHVSYVGTIDENDSNLWITDNDNWSRCQPS